MGKTTDIISEIVETIVADYGLSLVDVEYVKEGDNWILRVYIENLEGDLSLEHCEKVSRRLSEILDEKDPITDSYILEVSSPGIERPLKKIADYKRFQGELAIIKTYAPIAGEKEFKGTLAGIEKEQVKIQLEGEKELVIPLARIASAHLTIDF